MNEFWAVSGHPAIPQLVKAMRERSDILNRGERVNLYGTDLKLTDEEQAQLRLADIRMVGALGHLAEAARYRAGGNEQCPCGSGRKYKRCCAGAAA
jgi:uncharacterized protein YecA (UPF0149 family)